MFKKLSEAWLPTSGDSSRQPASARHRRRAPTFAPASAAGACVVATWFRISSGSQGASHTLCYFCVCFGRPSGDHTIHEEGWP